MAFPTIALAVFGLISLALYALYRRLLPQPIKGIPYHADSSARLLGDLPRVSHDLTLSQEVTKTRNGYSQTLRSPVIQLFLAPFGGRPTVFLDDPREAEDILLRRNKEFDRSMMSRDTIGVPMPHCTIVKATGPEWRAQRRLWADVMGPEFLRGVVAPRIWSAAKELVELWKVRSELSVADGPGRVIDVSHDFDAAALDAIWAAILGDELGGTRAKIEALKGESNALGKEEVTRIAKGRGFAMQTLLSFLDETIIQIDRAWSPALERWRLKRTGAYRQYISVRNGEINRLMRAAKARFERLSRERDLNEKLSDLSEHDTCAMDLVLRRELLASQKAGMPMPDPTQDEDMRDELSLLMWAVSKLERCAEFGAELIAFLPGPRHHLQHALLVRQVHDRHAQSAEATAR
jgi:hypothetical protein